MMAESMMGTPSVLASAAGRYATALFDLAREDKALDETNAAMEQFAGLLEESDDLRRLVRSPVLTAAEKWKALSAVLARAGIGGIVAHFMGLVTRKRRLFILERMIEAWRVLLARHYGEVVAEVTTAKALTGAQLETLTGVLKEAVGARVRVVLRIDDNLLGGLVVRVGSRMVDTSLAAKLNRLKNAMKEAG